jgi:glycosyltransferase involved in cell wall biosynthesis
MFKNLKVVVVMPAYNAAHTLQQTHAEVMAQDYVDQVIVVDDGSEDETVAIAEKLPNTVVHVHPRNQGYGANQKTCYKLALEQGGDIVIMVHPDYQYTPMLIPAMVTMIGNGLYHCVLGSRILGGYALKGGMPLWKYVANRFLTFVENVLMGAKLSEYHTGYRGFVAEVSCPTKYFPEASSINLPRSIKYGLGCLFTAVEFRLTKMRLISSKRFPRY